MGKTILELFQTKPLTQGPFVGQTAEEGYAVRDFKKETPLSGPSPLLNSTGFALANIARRNLSIKNGESLFEQETTGIRIIRLGAIPIIYGTELLRITQRTTKLLDVMKGNDTSVSKKIKNPFFPEKLIPSKLILESAFRTDPNTGKPLPFPLTPDQLAKIRNDAAGNIVGKFLAKNVSGTPTQIGRAVVGGAITAVKSAVRRDQFGSPNEAAQNLAKKREGGTDYDSKTKYSKTVAQYSTDIELRNDISSNLNKLKNPPPSDPALVGPPVPEGFIIPTFPTERRKNRFNYDETNSLPSGSYLNTKFIVFSEPKDRKDLSSVLVNEQEKVNSNSGFVPKTTFPSRNNRNKYFYDSNNQERYAYTGKSNFSDDNIRDVVITGAARGINNGADAINAYDVGQNDEQNIIDFITLKFDTTQFRATITGLTETFSPSWDSNKFIGSPFNYYTYSGIERSVSFNFKVFSLNIQEHNNAWNKLQYLAKKTYPIGYVDYGVVAPIIDFTMTDLYSRKKSFIESLSFTIDDNYPWEVFVEGLRLPHIIDVAITLKFIEQRGDEAKLYDFENLTNLPSVKRASKGEDQKIKEKPIAN